jgi:hypothetical protein
VPDSARHDRRKTDRDPMHWFRVQRERVRYRGRISRDGFAAWVKTPPALETVRDAASGIRFGLLGRTRAAQKRIWHELRVAASTREAASALEGAAIVYGRALADLAYSPELPRVNAGIRRVVLVPRALVAGKARAEVSAHIARCRSFARLPESIRVFLLDQVLVELDGALCAAQPSPQRPVAAASEWVCVGTDTTFGWVDQIWTGPGWSGHFIVYERPHNASRSDRKAVEHAVEQLQAGVHGFSRERRQQIAQAALNQTSA